MGKRVSELSISSEGVKAGLDKSCMWLGQWRPVRSKLGGGRGGGVKWADVFGQFSFRGVTRNPLMELSAGSWVSSVGLEFSGSGAGETDGLRSFSRVTEWILPSPSLQFLQLSGALLG